MYGYPGSSGPEPTREANDVNRHVRKVMRKLVEHLALRRDGSAANGSNEESSSVDASSR